MIPVFDVNRVKEEKMLRRKPTRLELKIDDTGEFESVKKELEVEFSQYELIIDIQ